MRAHTEKSITKLLNEREREEKKKKIYKKKELKRNSLAYMHINKKN